LLFLAGRVAGGTIGPRTPEIAVKTNGVRWHILNQERLCAQPDAGVYDARHKFM
jgi:hypothetical protein